MRLRNVIHVFMSNGNVSCSSDRNDSECFVHVFYREGVGDQRKHTHRPYKIRCAKYLLQWIARLTAQINIR